MSYLGNQPNRIVSPNTLQVNTFTGNNTTGPFALAFPVGSLQNVDVMVAGVYQHKNTYTIIGSTLTFTEAPPTGLAIEVVCGR